MLQVVVLLGGLVKRVEEVALLVGGGEVVALLVGGEEVVALLVGGEEVVARQFDRDVAYWYRPQMWVVHMY